MTQSSIRQRLQDAPLPKRDAQKIQHLSVSEGEVEVMTITPEFAADLLTKRHPHQRPLKEHYIADLADAMSKGRWRWQADPFRLDGDLNVIDGQHRLSAAVRANFTFHDALVAIVTGKDVILSIDQNRPRTFSDMRATRGLASLSRTITGAVVAETCDWSQWRGMPRELQLRTVEECPYVNDLVELHRGKGEKNARSTVTVGAMSGALRCIRTNRDDAMKFFGAVFSMNPFIDGVKTDMVHVLFSFLMESKAKSFSSEQRTIEHAHKSISAYNHWKSGRVVSHLLWKGGAPPRVIG